MSGLSDSESVLSGKEEASGRGSKGWAKIALITAASALAGGLATAWFYRKTLTKLRETGENRENPDFGISAEEEGVRPTDEI